MCTYIAGPLGNYSDASFSHACLSNIYEINDTVEAHSCLQAEKCCGRRLFIWLQSGDVTNACVNKVNTMICSGTQAEVTLVRV